MSQFLLGVHGLLIGTVNGNLSLCCSQFQGTGVLLSVKSKQFLQSPEAFAVNFSKRIKTLTAFQPV